MLVNQIPKKFAGNFIKTFDFQDILKSCFCIIEQVYCSLILHSLLLTSHFLNCQKTKSEFIHLELVLKLPSVYSAFVTAVPVVKGVKRAGYQLRSGFPGSSCESPF